MRRILSLLLVILISCSEDNNEDPKTFLEEYGGTSWISEDWDYVRFINSTTTPFEAYGEIQAEDCFAYTLATDYILVQQNSNELVLDKIQGSGFHFYHAFKISGESMSLIQEFVTPVSSNIETVYFTKTSQNFDNLNICPD